MNFWAYAFVVIVSIGTVLQFLNYFELKAARKERDKLLNRIMSKNYEQYEYYEKKYDKDLDEVEKLREEDHADRKEFEEQDITQPVDTKATKFLENLEEDWDESELDLPKGNK